MLKGFVSHACTWLGGLDLSSVFLLSCLKFQVVHVNKTELKSLSSSS